MKIAVCSKDFKRVTGHAGQARHWLLFEVDEGHSPQLIDTIELEKRQTFHHFKDDGPHPLDGIAALLASSSGESFVRKMKRRGVDAVMSSEENPLRAVEDYVARRLKPAKARPIMGLICKVRDWGQRDT